MRSGWKYMAQNSFMTLNKTFVGEESTYRHVSGAPGRTCIRFGIHKSPANTEIAQFDIALFVDEDIWRFNVSMYDIVILF